MNDNFKKTVNLKETRQKKQKNNPIDRVYSETGEKDFHTINRPKEKKVNETFVKRLVIFLALILILVVLFFIFSNKENPNKEVSTNWYSVKLASGEIFYGQIEDTKADPVVIKNVYYNYDQQEETGKEIKETGNLRLVKRGKETHGPDGTMNIVRQQVLYMEPLKEDSKVLGAILNYEK